MAEVVPFPTSGTVLFDERGEDRSLRVSWHAEAQVVVLTHWRAGACVSSFRLSVGEVPALVTALVRGLVPEGTARADRSAG